MARRALVTLWLLAVAGGAEAATPAAAGPDKETTSMFPGTAAGAEALLRRFLAPTADRVALTAALRPRPEDYAAVYDEPLAGKLAADHAALWQTAPAVGPNPGQTELLLTVTTTDALRAGAAELQAFPGGYAGVVAHMKPGLPIARWKFVQPGSTSGMAFDGLVFVDGRWVFMPKPWRSL